jgi:hypothetical protein
VRGGQRPSTGLLVRMKYGGDFVGPKATTVVMKALRESGKDRRTGPGEVKTGLASR